MIRMSKKHCIKTLVLTIFILSSVFFSCFNLSRPVSAVCSGSGCTGTGVSDGVEVHSCEGHRFYTGYGATWRYYTATSDSISISGYSGVTDGGTITGCATNGGGYYRYALVACPGATGVIPGEQYGLTSIGSSDYFFKSAAFGGGLNYLNTGLSWDEVAAKYTELKAEELAIYGRNIAFTYEWNGSSGLSWFCGGTPTGRDYAKSDVSNLGDGGAVNTTGITGTFRTASTSTMNIEAGETVDITFQHNIYNLAVGVTMSYSIEKTGFSSGGISISSSSSTGTVTGVATSSSTAESGYYPGEPRAYAGSDGLYLLRDVYSITFETKGTYVFCESVTADGVKLTQVCTTVAVEGEPTVDNCSRWLGASGYSGGYTSVISAINNNGLSLGWQGVINGTTILYAMPTDEIDWQNCYFPGAQRLANSGVSRINTRWKVSDKSHSGCSNLDGDATVFQYQPDPTKWTNEYLATTSSPYGFNDNTLLPSGIFTKDFTGGNALTNGDTTIREIANNYKTTVDNVGSTYADDISTTGTPIFTSIGLVNHDGNYWNPRCCSSGECGTHNCSYTSNGQRHTHSCCNTCTVTRRHYTYDGTRVDGERASHAEIRIPYNFINTTTLGLDRSTVFSGEEIAVTTSSYTVGTKSNSLTERTYATMVRGAQVKLYAYVTSSNQDGQSGITGSFGCGSLGDKQCSEVNSYSGTLNSSGNLSGETQSLFTGTYNSFDAAAGDYLCFALGVYPATSGSDDNLEASGDGQWYATRRCAIIAKKPSFTVYGGDFYTAGNVSTNISKKRNVYGIYGYSKGGTSNTTVYGSWDELGVTALGVVNGFASGAGSGLTSENGRRSGSREGGNVSFCTNRTTLSIANFSSSSALSSYVCPYAELTGNAGIASNTTNRKALVDFWGTSNPTTSGGYINLVNNYSTIASPTGVSIRFVNGGSGALSLSSLNVPASTTYIIRTTGDITITGNIAYTTARLTSIGQIPKVVIYGNNINIQCNVSELDAIIIAEGHVNTCSNAGDINDRSRSVQLNVRGMIIANSMTMGRTYGTAAGVNSGEPAEAINYDTSAILWGRYMAGSGESDTLTVTYQHELAPRY